MMVNDGRSILPVSESDSDSSFVHPKRVASRETSTLLNRSFCNRDCCMAFWFMDVYGYFIMRSSKSIRP